MGDVKINRSHVIRRKMQHTSGVKLIWLYWLLQNIFLHIIYYIRKNRGNSDHNLIKDYNKKYLACSL